MNLVYRTGGRIQRHVSNIAFEESATTQFDKTELTGIDIERTKLLLFAMQRETNTTWYIDIEATVFLVF